MNIPRENRTLHDSFLYIENYYYATIIGKDPGFSLQQKYEDMIPGYLGEFFYKGMWGDGDLAVKAATTIFE